MPKRFRFSDKLIVELEMKIATRDQCWFVTKEVSFLVHLSLSF